MMNLRQTRIVLASIAFVLAAWIFSALFLSRREPALPMSAKPLSFNAPEAYRATQEFVTQFPTRVTGSFESRPATGYLQDSLQKLGYSVSFSHFDARIARRRQVGRNVLAYRQEQNPEIIALIAHLDTAKTTVQGAMDDGSGVGVLLELARVFSLSRTRRSLLIIFSDGEEWGMLGARDVAENYPERNRIVAVLSLDHVGIGELKAFCLEETGQLKGFTPPWLRTLARRAGESQGLPVREAFGLSEYLDRAILISGADQGPFLAAGMPSINLGSRSKDQSREKEIYHTREDTIEKLRVSSIEKYGLAAERIVRSLDELPSIPLESSGSFRLWDSRYLGPGIITALQIISFLPLPLVLWFYLENYHRTLNLTGMGREFLAFLGTLLPFWVIYFLIPLVRILRLIPTYTLYPATAKDPVLANPQWGILAAIAGTALFVAGCCSGLAWYSFRELPKPRFPVSKTVLLILLLITVALALRHNPYWASAFLFLPAWTWALCSRNGESRRHIKTRLLIIGAGIVYYAALGLYGSRLGMSWNFIWYQVLALSDGLFTKEGYLLGSAAAAIGIRFLAIQSHEVAAKNESVQKR